MKFQPFSFWWKKLIHHHFYLVIISALCLLRYCTGKLSVLNGYLALPIGLSVLGFIIPAFTAGFFEKIYDKDFEKWIETGDREKGLGWRYTIIFANILALVGYICFSIFLILRADWSTIWIFIIGAITINIVRDYLRKRRLKRGWPEQKSEMPER